MYINDFIKKKISVGLDRLDWMHKDVENLQNIKQKFSWEKEMKHCRIFKEIFFYSHTS